MVLYYYYVPFRDIPLWDPFIYTFFFFFRPALDDPVIGTRHL